jgi:anaerobic magnesium-protoporphyrin IX monomethyl ester cyclase
MRMTLIGADFEENLALCMLSAAVSRAGHTPDVIAFNDDDEIDGIADRVVAASPEVVGLSMQFQHRAHEFLRLAAKLRTKGYRGHVTCGGQFPTMAWEHVLAAPTPIDSVVLYDGEETVVDLLRALSGGGSLDSVAGLALPGAPPKRTPPRPFLTIDLDSLATAKRYRRHSAHGGVPFIPILGGRGCWGSCSYCSITTFYRDGRASTGPGKTVRLRSPQSVAEEMAVLWHAAGGAGVFCFHDDNFLMPRASDTLERVRAIRAHLDALGVGRAAIVGKARPDCIDEALAKELHELGVIRLYVGVENASPAGASHLGRRRQGEQIRQALAACRAAGIFTCYNLLVFEPETTLADVRENVAFIREHASHPVNFCRAEPYHATPLHRQLEATGRLRGSVLGWDYRLADDRAELLFRICASAFRNHNFASHGVANRYMGLGYVSKIIQHFNEDSPALRSLVRRTAELTREISLDTADHLERALVLAETVDLADRERIERETALLGLEIAATDRVFHARLDEVFAELDAFGARAADKRKRRVPPRIARIAERVGLATLVGFVTANAAVSCGSTTVDPVPSDAGADAGADQFVVDMAPPDAGADAADASDADATVVDPPPADAGVGMLDDELIDHWRDTAPRRAVRSPELPLFDPPDVKLAARREGDAVHVELRGGPAIITTRWQADGVVEGDGRCVVWHPASADDLLCVAVRSRGGVTTTLIRPGDVPT